MGFVKDFPYQDYLWHVVRYLQALEMVETSSYAPTLKAKIWVSCFHDIEGVQNLESYIPWC
jgi:hypothetical protein